MSGTRYLVIAHQTATSIELAQSVSQLVAADPDSTFAILIPALHSEGKDGPAQAQLRAEEARALLRSLNARVERTLVGDSSPFIAIEQELERRPGEYDQIILCTLPEGISQWLRMGTLQEARRSFGLPVIHIIGSLSRSGRAPRTR